MSASRRGTRVLAETGPVPEEAQNLPDDTGILARLVTSRTAVVFTVLVVLALLGARGLLGSGMLSGGALLPAPASVGHWWELYLEGWHTEGVGSDAPAAPYLLPLALAATLLLGKAWAVVDILFLLTVPLAAWGAARFLGTLDGRGWPRLWGAVAYGLLPVLTGAVAQGRLGTVAAAVILPWVAHAALFLHPARDRDRRWRAAWRTALLLALLTAFVPLAWPVAALLAVVAVAMGVAGVTGDRAAWATPRTWGPMAMSVLVVPVLLLPWSLLRWVAGATGPWYAEAGLPATELVADLGPWELLAGRATTTDLGAAPLWIGVGLAVAAVAALVRRGTRPVVVGAWVVVVVAVATAVLLDGAGEWAGFPVLLAQAAAVTAVAVAGEGIGAQLSGRSFGWHQPVGLLVVLGALLSPLAGLVWWAAAGVDGPLDRQPPHGIPAYMTDAAMRDEDNGILVVRDHHGGLGYSVVRGEGARLGDDTVMPPAEEQADLTALVADLATAPTAEQVEELAGHGVEFVYLPPPADPDLVGNLDSVSGMSSASALRPGSRAWQLDTDPSREAPPPASWLHPALLVVQALAIVVAAVLAAPTRKVRR